MDSQWFWQPHSALLGSLHAQAQGAVVQPTERPPELTAHSSWLLHGLLAFKRPSAASLQALISQKTVPAGKGKLGIQADLLLASQQLAALLVSLKTAQCLCGALRGGHERDSANCLLSIIYELLCMLLAAGPGSAAGLCDFCNLKCVH